MIYTDFFLFVYDIHDEKALRKVSKRLEQINSMRIQKSVFEIEGTKEEVDSLISDIVKIIDSTTDRVAVIPLCERDYERVEFYGLLSRRAKESPAFYIL